MADFFGGILDSVRNVGDDVGQFFNSFGGSGTTKDLTQGQQEQGFYSSSYRGFQDPFDYRPPSDKNLKEPPADFNTIEQQWIRRLQRFSDIQTQTRVNEGKPEAQ